MPPVPPEGKRTHDGRSRGSEVASEDFLFHLYRGSELLQDNRVHEAKEELEMAIRLQPLDPKGQDLLGVVYFRLGMYPRAIEIFEQLVAAYPEERTPRVNLALSYLKTGQAMMARQILEASLMLHPDNPRAWGYLGLAYERLGDYMKAREAFARGGHEGMSRRMDELFHENLPARSLRAPSQRPAEPFQELDNEEIVAAPPSRPPPSRPPSIPPAPVSLGAYRAPSLLPPPSSFSDPPASLGSSELATATDFARRRMMIFPATPRAISHGAGCVLVTVNAHFACRAGTLRGFGHPQSASPAATPLPRLIRGKRQDEPLGGPANPLLSFAGLNQILLGPSANKQLHAFALADETISIREDALVAFDQVLLYENGRLAAGDGEAIPMVQLRGDGPVVLEVRGELVVLEVSLASSVTLRREHVLGWLGHLSPHALPPSEAPAAQHGLVGFSGEGMILVEGFGNPPP